MNSIEDSIQASTQRRKVYIEKHVRKLVMLTRNNTDKTRINRTEITWKQKKKWEEKELYVRFKPLTSDISHEKTGTWKERGTEREKLNLS